LCQPEPWWNWSFRLPLDRDGGRGDPALDAQRWALPFWCVLATTLEVSEQLGKRHQTIAM
jgi:hypothetical protein